MRKNSFCFTTHCQLKYEIFSGKHTHLFVFSSAFQHLARICAKDRGIHHQTCYTTYVFFGLFVFKQSDGCPTKKNCLLVDFQTQRVFCFGHAHGMWKFLGQGSNPHHSNNNARSLTWQDTRELPGREFFIFYFWLLQ